MAVPIDLGAEVGQLRLPLLGLGREKLRGDHLIELVQIERFQTAFQEIPLLLELGNRILVKPTFLRVAFLQGADHHVQQCRLGFKGFQSIFHLPGNLFFPDIFFRAFAFIAGAMVIDVLPLFQIADHGAPAMPAKEHALKHPIMLAEAGPVGGLPIQNLLHPVEQFPGDQGLMGAVVELPVPGEISVIDRIVQDLGDGAARHLEFASPRDQALLMGEAGQFR
ncbi:MAG TPA: hypothetical protein VJ385_08060 [Fibrobacteria bacterium]|nr:hypothetical protein [Fibrobacteria bacterium]